VVWFHEGQVRFEVDASAALNRNLQQDAREGTRRIRPAWKIDTPEMRERWERRPNGTLPERQITCSIRVSMTAFVRIARIVRNKCPDSEAR